MRYAITSSARRGSNRGPRRRCGRLRPAQFQRVHRTTLSPGSASGSGRQADSGPASVHSTNLIRQPVERAIDYEHQRQHRNGTLARLLRLKALRSRAYLKESDRSRTACERLVSIRDAGKQKQFGRTEQRETTSSWQRLAVAVLFFIITAIAGHAPKKQIAAKPQAQQQKQAETKRPKAALRLLWTLCVPPRRTFGRPTWPRRHPEDTRIDGSECAQSSSDATEKPATGKPRAGRTLASVPTFEQTQQKWKILRLTAKRQTSQLCRTSSRTH